jgi:hypothetical protein
MRCVALAVVLLAAARLLPAQPADGSLFPPARWVTPPGAQSAIGERSPLPRLPRPTWWAPVASAAVPGSGQAVLSQKRWLPYLAFEIWAWIQYVDTRREGSRRRGEYQSLARDVARSRFPGPYPVGEFEYYEHMLETLESGNFDRMPGGAIDPETDTTTYNGRRWLDARRLYWSDPEQTPPLESEPYENAIEFYEQNAVGPEFRWSWTNAQLEYDVFRRTIARSNRAYKRSVQYLGVIIANHALSAVDAFVTLRIRTRAEMPGYLELEGSLPIASILPRH